MIRESNISCSRNSDSVCLPPLRVALAWLMNILEMPGFVWWKGRGNDAPYVWQDCKEHCGHWKNSRVHHPSAIHWYFWGEISIRYSSSGPSKCSSNPLHNANCVVSRVDRDKFWWCLCQSNEVSLHLPQQKAHGRKAHIKSQGIERPWCGIRDSILLQKRSGQFVDWNHGKGMKFRIYNDIWDLQTWQASYVHWLQAFDDLLLMKVGGYIIYHGPLGRNSTELVKYFEVIFFSCFATHQPWTLEGGS